MKIVIADTGVIISLELVNGLELIEKTFGSLYIPNAVWEELNEYGKDFYNTEFLNYLKSRIISIKGINNLSLLMDYGESESVILYKELEADFLIIDDAKARLVAESLNVNCIGSIGLLIKAKELGLINELRPIFINWVENKRHFSKKLLNNILASINENSI